MVEKMLADKMFWVSGVRMTLTATPQRWRSFQIHVAAAVNAALKVWQLPSRLSTAADHCQQSGVLADQACAAHHRQRGCFMA